MVEAASNSRDPENEGGSNDIEMQSDHLQSSGAQGVELSNEDVQNEWTNQWNNAVVN